MIRYRMINADGNAIVEVETESMAKQLESLGFKPCEDEKKPAPRKRVKADDGE